MGKTPNICKAFSAASSFALLTYWPSYQNLAGTCTPWTVTRQLQAVRPPGRDRLEEVDGDEVRCEWEAYLCDQRRSGSWEFGRLVDGRSLSRRMVSMLFLIDSSLQEWCYSLISRSWCGDGALPAVPCEEEVEDMIVKCCCFERKEGVGLAV